MSDILLPTPEDLCERGSRGLITRDHIIRREYQGWRRTRVTVYEIPDYILGEHLGLYLMQ